MTHPYKDILIAIANGEEVQIQSATGDWVNDVSGTALGEIYFRRFSPSEFRVKPKTININGYEVPEPMRHPPSYNSTYWLASPADGTPECAWLGDESDVEWLEDGLIHATQAAARVHRDALLSFTKAK